MSKTKKQPLENLDATLSDVPSNAHGGASDRFHGTDDDFRNAGMDPPEPKAKKPRTASPDQLASRAFQRLCDLQAQRAREAMRHAEQVAKIDRDVAELEAEMDAAPEVRRFFEAMRTAAEVKS